MPVSKQLRRKAEKALVAERVPGHAMRDAAMGFCVYNFAACAARYAVDGDGASPAAFDRVAVLDAGRMCGRGAAPAHRACEAF